VPGKPVGTVCFGWALRGSGPGDDAPRVRLETLRLPGDRAEVRRAAARYALDAGRAWLQAEFADRPPVG
jgi:nicotinamide mononucleotide (NMN) deamidase PncC